MMRCIRPLCLATCFGLSALGLTAQPSSGTPENGQASGAVSDAEERPGQALLPAEASVTEHTVELNGETIAYTATAGTLTLRDAEEKPTAEIFYIAYTRKGVERADRPITFSFNGGPGSSSVWLHMGVLGPRRVHLEADGSPVPPPYKLVDNEASLLDVTDLVFIDPVSTGFSRAKDPETAKRFHGVEGDTSSVADFIRLYTTRHARWTSPKFLIGESYGTTRAAALAGELAEEHRMNLNGLILVSAVLDFQTIRFTEGNDLPFVLFLPTYTATAWYHEQLPDDLQERELEEVLARAESFAAGPYQSALFAGASLEADERAAVLGELARFTGLDEAYLDRTDLRPTIFEFTAELLRGQDKVVGRFDSRYTGHALRRDAPQMEFDPSGEAFFSAYASTFQDYVRTELGFETDRPYEILTRNVWPWDWGADNAYLNVAETLAEVLTQQPFLRLHIDNGYYDLATPYWATHYTLNHLGVPPAVRERISMEHYTAGHMMYLNLPDLARQKAALAKFIRKASGQ
ncbi:MAG: S10 family peptidase [Opitutales bacterium]